MKTLLFLAVCFCISTLFAQPAYAPKGDVRNTTIEDFYKHPSIGGNYNEAWRYAFVFDDGSKAFVNYTYMTIPVKGTKCGADISVFNFNGKNYQIGREYPKERFIQLPKESTIAIKHATGPDNVFAMRGKPGNGHTITYKTSKGAGFDLSLSFSDAILGKVQGDGVFRMNGEQVGHFIHIPYARVSGTLTVGAKKKTVTGYAYMEQIWQTSLSTELSSHALNLYGPQSKILGNIFVGSKKLDSKIFGYVINTQDTSLHFIEKLQSRGASMSYSHKVIDNPILHLSSDSTVYTATHFKAQQKYSMLGNIEGWFAKKAAKIAMGGEAIFYRGTGQINNAPVDYSIYTLDD